MEIVNKRLNKKCKKKTNITRSWILWRVEKSTGPEKISSAFLIMKLSLYCAETGGKETKTNQK